MYPIEDRTRSLSATKRIGLLGDTHSDLEHILIVANTMWARGVGTLVMLGDSGFIWPGCSDLDSINQRLSERGQTLYWVCGNPERISSLYKFPFGDDGLRWVRSNIAHVPRCYNTSLSSGRTLQAMDGATSNNVGSHAEGRSWRSEESTADGIPRHEHVDLLIGNDAPNPLPALHAQLAETDHFLPDAGRKYSDGGGQQLSKGSVQVHPKLYLGRHYHQHMDEPFDYGASGNAAEARIVLLAMNGSTDAMSQATLDLRTLKFDFFGRADTNVTELTGSEAGCWRVTTRGSSHILDLDRWTATRVPGEGASATFNDRERPLLDIRTCRVGGGGFWTMDNDGWADPMAHYWHSSSEIRLIERIDTVPPAQDRRLDRATP